eukprot:3819997-Rhodomonas_salina.1
MDVALHRSCQERQGRVRHSSSAGRVEAPESQRTMQALPCPGRTHSGLPAEGFFSHLDLTQLMEGYGYTV